MPVTDFTVEEAYDYLCGFQSHHETEAIKGALPIGQASPQKPAFGLYAEKLSLSPFTAPRSESLQTWLYRILPASSHAPFEPQDDGSISLDDKSKLKAGKLNYLPMQMRWDPFDMDPEADWISGLRLIAGAGDVTMKQGLGIFIFAAGKDMGRQAFYSADGDLLIVLQHGVLDIQTELGRLLVRPNEICVIPRGIRYRVTLPHGPVRGYASELYQGHFSLPELGPIGSNGLANSRDFQAPVAAFVQDTTSQWTIVAKFAGRLYAAQQNHTPFDVVAWHGTAYPYKYDLGRFNTVGSISFDHIDPSIFTVLTAPSDKPGTAIADFVCFPPRWAVAENTYRPPYFHRNCMSEFMGLICGHYDAKAHGFQPAGASLHNVMSGHGPDRATHEKASEGALVPEYIASESMAFMFESCLMLGVTDWALENKVQHDYNAATWQPLEPSFKPPTEVQM